MGANRDGGLLMGIDLGTSGVKVGVFDPDGRMLGLGRSGGYTFYSPRPGWSQSDPWLWPSSISRAVSLACENAGVEREAIGAVGVSVFIPAVIPLDEAGTPIYPAILYNDQRSVRQVEEISRLIPRAGYEKIIGNVLVPGTCTTTSITWLRDQEPEVFEKTAVFAFSNTFVTSWLTGVLFTDPTMVSVSGLADIRDPWSWSRDLCGLLSIDPARLSQIAGSWELIGTVGDRASAATGLRKGTPVVNGCGDVVASSLGAGALEEGTIVYVAGSSDCLTTPLTKPATTMRWVNSAYIPKGLWLGVGTSTSSGAAVEWFSRELVRPGIPCSPGRPESGEAGDVHRLTAELAAAAPAGSRGLIFLPYLQGERTPHWDPLARGVFVGLSSSTTRADLARAVFEGTAFAFRDVFDCYKDITPVPVKEIRCAGGGTKNALWNRIKSDVLQMPLQVLEFQETGCFGAALLAGMGTGIYGSFGEAIETARRTISVQEVEPDPANRDLYQRLFSLYRDSYPCIRRIVHSLAADVGKADEPDTVE